MQRSGTTQPYSRVRRLGKIELRLRTYYAKGKLIPAVAKEWRGANKTFYRKHITKTKIAVKGISTSLHSFREKEEKNSHLPLDFFLEC